MPRWIGYRPLNRAEPLRILAIHGAETIPPGAFCLIISMMLFFTVAYQNHNYMTALWILISISTKHDLGTELLKETYKGVWFWHRTHLVTFFLPSSSVSFLLKSFCKTYDYLLALEWCAKYCRWSLYEELVYDLRCRSRGKKKDSTQLQKKVNTLCCGHNQPSKTVIFLCILHRLEASSTIHICNENMFSNNWETRFVHLILVHFGCVRVVWALCVITLKATTAHRLDRWRFTIFTLHCASSHSYI